MKLLTLHTHDSHLEALYGTDVLFLWHVGNSLKIAMNSYRLEINDKFIHVHEFFRIFYAISTRNENL